VELKTLIYTSKAQANIQSSEVSGIIAASRTNNPLDGITGLLVFNGASFLQIIEGSESAVDDLAMRLRGDPRHCDMRIHEHSLIGERTFPGWSMAYLKLENGTFIGEEAVADAVKRKLSPALRGVLLGMLGPSAEATQPTAGLGTGTGARK
jgi:hypothetical protein